MTDNIQEKVEDKVIDSINLGVSARLIIFKPQKKGMEDYLAVERRGEYKKKGEELYFEINSLVGPTKEKIFIKDFVQEKFKAESNFYLIFVYFNEITQKISDYIWLVPSLQFRDTAEVIKPAEGKKLLRFEAPLDFKQKSKYSKFLVNKDALGKTILTALENNGKFDFESRPEGGPFEEKQAINLERLKEFLVTARENTYASGASSVDNPRLVGSKQLEFQKGDYFYRDVYFSGDKKFIGQEIIYQDAKPVWGMNYVGSQLGKLETDFLKESLLRLSEKCRIGGNCEYEKRELKYQDAGQGSIEEFSGQEQIFSDAKSVYSLTYQGGLI